MIGKKKRPYQPFIASAGHAAAQAPQSVHLAASMM
jgi:hypothetical protein